MNDLPADIQRRRDLEDRAAELGNARRGFEGSLAANTQEIIEFLRDAKGSGIPFEQLAQLLGVSRQTVFNWRELADERDRARQVRATARRRR